MANTISSISKEGLKAGGLTDAEMRRISEQEQKVLKAKLKMRESVGGKL